MYAFSNGSRVMERVRFCDTVVGGDVGGDDDDDGVVESGAAAAK